MMRLTREPARIDQQGTFPLPSINARYTIGHDAVAEALPEFLEHNPGLIAVDIETAGGIDPKRAKLRFDIKAVIIGDSEQALILDPRDPYQYKLISSALNETNCKLVFHNSPFDVPSLVLTGLMEYEAISRVVDTVLPARIANPDETVNKGLGSCASSHLGITIVNPLPAILKVLNISKAAWFEFKDLDVPTYRLMAATDAILTHRLLPVVNKAAYRRLTSGHPFTTFGLNGDEALNEIEKAQILNRIHLRRSCKGFLIDPDYLDTYRMTTAGDMVRIEQELEALGIRPGNAGDLTGWLDGQGLLPADYPRTKKTHKPSGAAPDLDTLSHPVAASFVEWKKTTHILNDYLDKTLENADEDGRIHPAVNLLLAATGRMSISGDAPLHQFSAPARGIILAEDWEMAKATMNHPVLTADGEPHPCTCTKVAGMTSIDWSQIEPVITANIAGDVKAVEYYESGHKFYDALVAYGGLPYKVAKTTLLAQLYGEGLKKLARDLRITMDEAKKIVDLIWAVLPGCARLVEKPWKGGKLQSIAQEYKLIFTLAGRIAPIPAGWRACWEEHETKDQIMACTKCKSNGQIYSVQTHKGVNYFVQGSAYDLLADAEVNIDKAGLADAIYFPMHDELVVDSAAAIDIQRIMEQPSERLIMLSKRVPKLRTDRVHLGERWSAA